MEIYLDFDGTVVEHKYPNIGQPNPRAIDVITELQKQYPIILNTYRANLSEEHLIDAIEYLHMHRIHIDEVLRRKDMPPAWDLNYFEAINRIYIDDASEDVPLLNKPLMVDWGRVKTELEIRNIL